MNRRPIIGERVQVKGLEGFEPQNERNAFCRIEGFFLDTIYVRIPRKKEKIEVSIEQIVYLDPDKLTQDDRVDILKRLLKPESFKEQPIEMELQFLNRLVKNYPDLNFWRVGFNPEYKIVSMIWWFGGGKDYLRTTYQLFTQDLSNKKTNLSENLKKEKIGEDIVLTKKPKSLIDLFAK